MLDAFNQMKDALHSAVYESVGTKLLEESRKQQEELNEKLVGKLENFDESVRLRVDEVIKERLDGRVLQGETEEDVEEEE